MHPAGAIANPLSKFQLTHPPFVISAYLAALHFGVSHEYPFASTFSKLFSFILDKCKTTKSHIRSLNSMRVH